MSLREFLVAGGALAFSSCFFGDSAAAPASAKLRGATAPVVAEESGEECKDSADGKCGKSAYRGWLARVGVNLRKVTTKGKVTDHWDGCYDNWQDRVVCESNKNKVGGWLGVGCGDFVSSGLYLGWLFGVDLNGSSEESRSDRSFRGKTVGAPKGGMVVSKAVNKVQGPGFSLTARAGWYIDFADAMFFVGAGFYSIGTKVKFYAGLNASNQVLLGERSNRRVMPLLTFGVDKKVYDRWVASVEFGICPVSSKTASRSHEPFVKAVPYNYNRDLKNETKTRYVRLGFGYNF